jgi:hypothetical protein
VKSVVNLFSISVPPHRSTIAPPPANSPVRKRSAPANFRPSNPEP